MKKELYKKFKDIKLVLTDVDGVLTDGGMYYTTEGDIMKKYHALDGMGVTLLRKHNIPTILITKEKTKMVKQWAAKMKVEKLYDGIIKKNMILDKVCKTFNLKSDEIAYIGDDVNDVPLLKVVCLAVTPNDGTKEAKSVSHYICKLKGGEGAFREFADLIISTR